MNFKIVQIDEHLYTVQLQFSHAYQILSNLKEVDPLDWEIHEDHGGNNIKYIADLRPKNKNLFTGKFPLLENFEIELIKLKEDIATVVCQNNVFIKNNPELTRDYLMNDCMMGVNYYAVSPNFTSRGFHIDEPVDKVLVHGLIYLIPGDFDRPEKSTVFKNYNGTHNIVIPTGMAVGWMVVNSHKSLHRVLNADSEVRYGIKFNISKNY